MMRYLGHVKVLTLLLALFCAATLQADSLMLTSAPTGIIGPYVATINGTPGIEVICVSYFNSTNLNQNYTNYSGQSLSVFGPTDKPVSNSQGTWFQIAYLADKLFDVPAGPNQQALQWAIWYLADASTTPDVPIPSALSAAVTAVLNDATANAAAWATPAQLSNFKLYTASNFVQGVSGPQPFIVKTPEASAIFMLLLTGAGVAAFTWRQRRRILA